MKDLKPRCSNQQFILFTHIGIRTIPAVGEGAEGMGDGERGERAEEA